MSDHQRWAENMQRWEDGMMSVRDQFAVAAFAALLPLMGDGEEMQETCGSAWDWADAMLRERERTAPSTPQVAPMSDPASTPQEPRKSPADGDTFLGKKVVLTDCQGSKWTLGPVPEIVIHTTDQERFNAAVMNWVSEATSIYEPRSECGRSIMSSACMECWAAYGKHSTNHDAAPAARAPESEALRAGPPQPTDGTGTTFLTEAERLAIYTAAEWLSKLARAAATERAKELFDHATALLGLAGRMP